ncbi:hypothetical protein [Actinoplanes sp. HUAS TT8]|uniref:hypothetical protein n=1 Tax=Actinoplanes sp. HUAS TT8 TaxID=3447453 RepID=UPI003F525D9A
MITSDELVAAIRAIRIDAEIQVRLFGVPIAVDAVHWDERRAIFFLDLGKDEKTRVTTASLLARVLARDGWPDNLGSGRDHAVRRNARGHFELLRPAADE